MFKHQPNHLDEMNHIVNQTVSTFCLTNSMPFAHYISHNALAKPGSNSSQPTNKCNVEQMSKLNECQIQLTKQSSPVLTVY